VDYKLFYYRNGQETPINGNGSVTFEPGEASLTLRVRPIDDTVPEPLGKNDPPENVVITIGSSSRVQPDANSNTATVTIVDNDGQGGGFALEFPPPAMPIVYSEWQQETIGRGSLAGQSQWVRYKSCRLGTLGSNPGT
jgi:hypothetical protein